MHDTRIVGDRPGDRAHAASRNHGHVLNRHTKSRRQRGFGSVLAVALERNREKNVLARNEGTIKLYEHLAC